MRGAIPPLQHTPSWSDKYRDNFSSFVQLILTYIYYCALIFILNFLKTDCDEFAARRCLGPPSVYNAETAPKTGTEESRTEQ
jgi:hypothetical protein